MDGFRLILCKILRSISHAKIVDQEEENQPKWFYKGISGLSVYKMIFPELRNDSLQKPRWAKLSYSESLQAVSVFYIFHHFKKGNKNKPGKNGKR